MRFSKYHLPLLKEDPSEASIISHKLMLRSGMIRQTSQGIYAFLPIGLRVLNNIASIVRKVCNDYGLFELLMPTLQSADLWQESGRYESYGEEMLHLKDRHDHELLYSPTNEEMITDLFRRDVLSYKNLPLTLYQIHWKFRDEIRPRFGLMRGREFLMFDAYSFDINEESAKNTYQNYYKMYLEIFKNMGLMAIPMRAPTGPIGGNLSHEFQIIASTGESAIFYDRQLETHLNDINNLDFEQMLSIYAKADEEHETENCPVEKQDLVEKRGIEVGHIFYFGDKYTKALNAKVKDANGIDIAPMMGSYGIGVSRLVAAAIEANHDEKGIIWPENIAPFYIILLNLNTKNEEGVKYADNIYSKLQSLNIEVLYHDTHAMPGEKFSTADLIGMPYQIIVGKHSPDSQSCEVKERRTGKRVDISLDTLYNTLSDKKLGSLFKD